ncbi:ethanolamine ammonia-lyase small subunit [Bradyrhizobium sp. GM2.2]|jgi:ethanolamine ammonia-lyase small subunit|uniref:Ethanolamine ammonia-lyase small subunit n=1 Tax=Bradyrhizobium canariense TaxID=255045 RepID=A0A1X3F4E3_9BRAD|nr:MULTISPECIES: ethanolamine ammonia-lyase subunit EutC [Bradyrhizobium]MCK1272503.1 ethanolamine ammonia-lyase subunit EutC [Bradyrhizobium sp. 84]MCK1292745.1 ethanolamine ammonia-lyase subunit EutC [Bradyrhizobium sp. 30]MCK1310344.1 ethanolamine ammonia-lyase subunit EutC [Bradyrhizobium sp. 45]MCK1317963.1 ethanolamine ammonia-lyase subunit EutC [Bradyrhizobium sp. 23]MCK1330996.1 ethanolamine ammonia-lyase subunit EutC [Bradyrhizobium sp. CW9]
MSDPAIPRRPTLDLRSLTPARVALGRSGASLPTRALLDFTLDHARARDAVHAVFDAPRLVADLCALGLVVTEANSRAVDRGDYLRRPDLGRRLDAGSAESLARSASEPCQLALVIGDGLSAAAVHAHAAALVMRLLPLLAADDGVAIGHVVVASGARVALGDEIGAILGARMVVMLIGERPGLSAPDSLGAYLTFAPKPGRTDAERNCVSNIHKAGLSYDEAAFKIAWLVREGLAREVSGVALKDESADRAPRRIGTALPG